MNQPFGAREAERAATVVVPAHNEAVVIGRLLAALQIEHSRFSVVVVPNGCSDATAAVARSWSGVTVVELELGNKQLAMRAGAATAKDGPVVFVDADVVIDGAAVNRLVDALDRPGLLAVAPERVLDLEGASSVVTAYYRVWSRLPSVVEGLFGRGVLALSKSGYERVVDLPMFMSDDLALSESFSATERQVVPGATVRVIGPRRLSDLVRRRRRIAAGVQEFDAHTTHRQRTSPGTLLQIVRHDARRLPDVVVFVAVTLLVRVTAVRHGGASKEWLRDESSREVS